MERARHSVSIERAHHILSEEPYMLIDRAQYSVKKGPIFY